MFSNPIIYSIKRDENKILLTLYNLNNFNVESFNTIAQTNKTGFEARQFGANIYQIIMPVNENTFVDCYETLNASQLRFVFTRKIIQQPTQEPVVLIPDTKPEKVRPTTKKESIFSDLIGKPKRKETR